MSLIHLVVILIVVGLLLWLAVKYIPMEPVIKNILVAVVVICVVFFLLQTFGILGDASAVKVPQIR